MHLGIVVDYNTVMLKSNKALLLILAIVLGLLFSPVSALATETTQSLPAVNEIYPNAPGSSESGFEFIELKNASTQDIDLAGFQLKIKDKNKQMSLEGVLPASGFKAIITTFSLVNSGEVIQLQQLQNGEWVTIEEVSYGGSAPEDQSWSYFEDGWQLAPITQDLPNTKELAEVEEVDVCPATPGVDNVVPEGYEITDQGVCQLIPLELCENQVIINEFLSDPIGLESEGGEFIELYNPSDSVAPLLGCHLKTSKSSSDVITFTENDIIQPHGYFVVNLADKLTNASGNITFIAGEREDFVSYNALREGEDLSLFASGWEVTDKLTPNQANELVILSEEEIESIQDEGAPVPCSEGKYRNPDTGRCKNIVTAETGLADCDPGEYRSTETNRCRKVSLATASLAPCDVGQERSPTTNRCRKIQSSSDEVKPCKDGYERNAETNRCRKVASIMGASTLASADDEARGKTKIDTRIIAIAMALILGYGIYEYRTDLARLFSRISTKISRKNSPD